MKRLCPQFKQPACPAAICYLLLLGFASHLIAADATNSIVWHAETGTMDVDIDNKPLSFVAAEFKKATGREIHVPPGMTKTVSVKFSGKSVSESLSRILDGFNYYTDTRGGAGASRIVIVDPNDASPVPAGPKPMIAAPRPPGPPGGMAFRPGGSAGGAPWGSSGGPGSSRDGSVGSTSGNGGDRDRRPRTAEEVALEMLMREAGKSSGSGGGGDRSRYRDGVPGSPGSGPSSSGKSRSPRP